jgi:enamine deaminase RidA (YjgF/YER057c/UK114 family)
MRFRSIVAVGLAVALASGPLPAQRKKKSKKDEEPVTQTLPVLQDPPAAVTAETQRLSFRVAPLSAKGLLSQQVRDGLKALMALHRGAPIVKIRAFVAGTGDMRRVNAIVSETFTEKRLALPAVTTVQAGALPLEGAQVVLESIAQERKAVNPHGVALLQSMTVEQVKAALNASSLSGSRVLRATCYAPSLDGLADVRATLLTTFPTAAVNVVQMQRLPVSSPMTCEAVAALERTPAAPEFVDNARLVLLPPSKIVVTGAQLAFQAQEKDIRLAFERLGKTLESMRVGYPDVVAVTMYPLAPDVAEKVRAAQFNYFLKQRPPVISTILMEGLPSLDASFGFEAVAVSR